MMYAPDVCIKAAELMEERGVDRDTPEGERSMARCVTAFNAMTGHQLSEEDGWLFMVYLKHSRMRAGKFRQDDYEDAVAYEALMAESAAPTKEAITPKAYAPTDKRIMPLYGDNGGYMYPEDKDGC